ncbi:uncharacterized protein LOC144783971 isoform X1 [Lissotriton helveticus]
MMEGASSQMVPNFDDVIVHFSEDEWSGLELWQRNLYLEVAKENYDMLVSLGYPGVKPPVLLHNEEEQLSNDLHPGVSSTCSPVLQTPVDLQNEEDEEPVSSVVPEASNSTCYQVVKSPVRIQSEEESEPVNNNLPGVHSTCYSIANSLVLVQGEEEEDEPPVSDLCPGNSLGYPNKPHIFVKSEEADQSISNQISEVSSARYPIVKPLVFIKSEEEEQMISHHLLGFNTSVPVVNGDELVPLVKQEEEETVLENGNEDILRLLVTAGFDCKPETEQLQVQQKLHENLYLGENDFFRLQNAKEHWENLALGRSCSCPHCTLSFSDDKTLKPPLKKRRGRKKGQTVKNEDTLDPTYHPTKYQQILMGVKPHACSKCGKRFNQKGNLHVHQKIHTGEKPFACGDCGKRFSQKVNLTAHQRSHLGLKPFTCTECGKHFTCEQSVRMHQKIHTGEKSYFCTQCGKGFIQKGNLSTHLRIHTGERPHVCTLCGKGFTQKGTLVTHLKSHTRQRSYACRICEVRFDEKEKLAEHNKIHGNGFPFSCHLCGRQFNLKGNLKKHLIIHARHGSYPYPEMDGDSKKILQFIVAEAFLYNPVKEEDVGGGIMLGEPNQGDNYFLQLARFAQHQASPILGSPCTCLECETFLKNKHIPKPQHVIRRGRPRSQIKFENIFNPLFPSAQYRRIIKGEKTHECDQCGKRFNQKGNLTVHQKTHLPEKPFRCNECGRGFCQKISLITHERTHLGLKPYGCSECGKHFTCEQSVRMHYKIHTGEKSYFCPQCGKGFIQKGNLRVHQRIHTGEKPYTCTLCGKSFAQNGTLKAHHRSHTRERSFSCGVCDKIFSDQAKLKVHSQIHGTDSLFVCHRCGRKFSQKGNLKTHLKIHSGEKPHKCSQCWRSFRQRQHLLKHQLCHRGGRKIIFRGRKPGSTKDTNTTCDFVAAQDSQRQEMTA